MAEGGERVKVTRRFANALLKRPRKRIDWHTRRGVVVRCNANHVAITWEGRKSLEFLPLKAIEAA